MMQQKKVHRDGRYHNHFLIVDLIMLTINQFYELINFIINYNQNSSFGHVLIVDFDFPENWQPLHKDFPFLTEKKRL